MSTTVTTDQWQCSRKLPECLLYMLEHQIACDVKFLLGENREEIPAHRFILISRSPVFHSMLEGPLAEKGNIIIEDIEKEAFAEFLRFLYTDKYTPPSQQQAISVLYCAKKYCVDLLSTKCLDYLKGTATPENVCLVLGVAFRYDETSVLNKCMDIFKNNIDDCMEAEEFKDLPKEVLSLILDLNEMSAEEEDLYEGVIQWAEAQCSRQELELSSPNLRTVLGDLLYKIRFPAMDPAFFSKNVANSDFLTDQEKLFIFTSFHIKQTGSMFKCQTRKNCDLIEVRRFGSVVEEGTNNCIDMIGFELSHQGKLHGVLVFGTGSISRPSKITYRTVVKDTKEQTHLLVSEKSILTSCATEYYRLMFGKPVTLQPARRYTIEMTILSRSKMKYGEVGKQNVKYSEEKTVSFFKESGSNYTNVTKGQIPGLILS